MRPGRKSTTKHRASMMIDYHNKKFRPVANVAHGESSAETLFVYRQEKNILMAEYEGGTIVKGHLIGLVAEDGSIDMRYHQVNKAGELMTGVCRSTPEILANGKIRLHESWQWTSGNRVKGSSVLEEVY